MVSNTGRDVNEIHPTLASGHHSAKHLGLPWNNRMGTKCHQRRNIHCLRWQLERRHVHLFEAVGYRGEVETGDFVRQANPC